MNNFAEWITTFERAQEIDETITERDFNRMVRYNEPCQVCGQHVWRYVENELCFTCTTGESDASGDYEIGEEYD